jgi:hypothetical protein
MASDAFALERDATLKEIRRGKAALPATQVGMALRAVRNFPFLLMTSAKQMGRFGEASLPEIDGKRCVRPGTRRHAKGDKTW